MDLPCLLEQWEAETSQAWTACHPWAVAMPRSERFDLCLCHLLQDPAATNVRIKDNYQRYLMVTTLTRMMWSLKEQTTQPGAHLLTPQNALQQGKQDLLDVVNYFSFSPKALQGSVAPEYLAARIQQLALVKLAHILTADDVWDYLHLIWRKHSQVELGQHHVLKWIREKPRSWRAFTVANAQLLSITRLYPDNHPHEAYNVFHAGMAIWVMSTLVRTTDQATKECQDPLVCHLDWLGSENAPEALALQDWVENGGNQYVVRIFGVPDLFAVEGAQQVLRQTAEILNRMPVWGIAHTLRNATLRVLHSVETFHVGPREPPVQRLARPSNEELQEH